MKLYGFDIAPNPTRVMAYVAEKGIDIEQVPVSLIEGEHRSPEHLARSPAGVLPVLELDDGSFLGESLVIMEYLEELYPEPVMIGRTALERARVRSAERQAEMSILVPATRIVHATRSPLGLPPSPEVAAREADRFATALQRFDARIGAGPFVMGDAPTIADCTLFAGLQFGLVFGLDDFRDHEALSAWYDRFSERQARLRAST